VSAPPRGPRGRARGGATLAGGMGTVWQGGVNPPRPGTVRTWRYDDTPVTVRKGDEMGRFLLGSTVVLLFPRGTVAFNPQWAAERPVRLGEAMAQGQS